MSWDDEKENNLYIDKQPCPECGGNYAMVYEPYEDKNGSRICGFVCVDCGHAAIKNSKQMFSLYTGKNKIDVWDLDNDYDIYSFHPEAQRIIMDMKAGRYFKLPKPKKLGQPKPQPKTPVYEQPKQPVYQPPKPSVQKPIVYIPPQEVIKRPFIDYDVDEFGYVTDFNKDYSSGDYKKTAANYKNKRTKGFSLDANEQFRLAYSLGEIGQHSEAVKEWTTYISRFPNNADIAIAYNNRGVEYSNINEIDKSTEDYKWAIKLGYSGSDNLKSIIEKRESSKTLEAAILLFNEGKYSEVINKLEQLNKVGKLEEHLFKYAYSLYETNRTSESVDAYTKFITKNSNNTDIPAAYNNRAIAQFKLNNQAQGFADYWQAYINYQSDEKKNLVLTRIYNNSKKYYDIEQFEKVLKEQRRRGISDELDSGKFYMDRQMFEKAKECFSKINNIEAESMIKQVNKLLNKKKNESDDIFYIM